MADYYIRNKKYVVKSSPFKGERVEEYKMMFDKFYSTTGNIYYFDNMREVREFLKDENGGIPIC